jgi:uncharacterized protein (UPF0332 family)
MSTWSWRTETEGRLRKAEVSLEAARSLIDRKPPCIDDAVNRASAAALQAARALVDARWPPHDPAPHDPSWRPGMPPLQQSGPYSKAPWPEIVRQFEKAADEMALPHDATEYLRALVEDGHIADVGDNVTYEPDEAREAVGTAEKLVKSVVKSIELAFAMGDREAEDGLGSNRDENETTLETMPVVVVPQAPPPSPTSAPTDPSLPPLPPDDLPKSS